MKGMTSYVEFGVQWKQDPPLVFDTFESASLYRKVTVDECVGLGLVDYGDHMRVVTRTVWHHESTWAAVHA